MTTTTTSSCTLACVPDNVIQGTMDLEPDDPDHLKIISIKRAPAKNKFAKLEIPDHGCKNVSLYTFLQKNIERQVMLTTTSKGNIQGKIKWIHEVAEACDGEDMFVMIETGDVNNKSDTLINIAKIDEIHGITTVAHDGQKVKMRFSGSGGSDEKFIFCLRYSFG